MSNGPRVRVELLGGLGNQLFQAATAYSLCQRLGGTLEFDVSRFSQKGSRAYALAGLGHGATVVGEDVSGIQRTLSRVQKAVMPKGMRKPAGWSGAVFREASYAYDPRFDQISGDCCLSGYFHSARYFAGAEAAVRQVFDLSAVASDKAKAFAAAMPAGSLAVHVRIGDFKDSRFSAVHGTLDPRYYRDAIRLVVEAKRPEVIYLFTDTPDTALRVMPEGVACEPVRGFDAVDDLFLMSSTTHHIIANSTFSWWGAYFAPQPDSLVVAPRAWLTPQALQTTYIGDLYPEGWVML